MLRPGAAIGRSLCDKGLVSRRLETIWRYSITDAGRAALAERG